MSFYNTGNPVPSIDPRDLDDNAKILDNLVSGTEQSYPDRLGTIRASWKNIEQTLGAIFIRPELYGAVGDGVANDTAAYQLAEAAAGTAGVVYLSIGKTYALQAGTIPTASVVGSGVLKIGSVEFSALQLDYDLYRTSLYFTPTNYTEEIGFPTAGDNMAILLSPGAARTGSRNRSTVIGTQNLEDVIEIDRIEGVGNLTLQHIRYGNRIGAYGSTSCQYLGTNDPQGVGHNWFGTVESGGFLPGQPGWDYGGFETANPGIGAKIAAFTGFSTAVSDMGRVYAVGRDTFNAAVVANDSNAFGYRALASAYNVSGVNAFGTDAFRNGILLTNSIALGHLAGRNWQEGTRNTISGYQVANAAVRGDSNTLYGSFAGSDYTDLNGCILIGLGAGNGLGGTSQTDILAIGNTGTPLISGNLTSIRAGINTPPASLAGTFHVTTNNLGAGAANSNGDDLVVENSTNAGITIRASTTGLSSLFMADSALNNVAGLVYNHSTDALSIRIAAADRWVANATSLSPAVDGGQTLGATATRASDTFSRQYTIGTGTVRQLSGTGTPEGVVTAVVGSTFQRSDGGTLTSFYVKETGTGNTGWVAK